jgi:hypothetical protein
VQLKNNLGKFGHTLGYSIAFARGCQRSVGQTATPELPKKARVVTLISRTELIATPTSEYISEDLPPGNYVLTASAPGFAESIMTQPLDTATAVHQAQRALSRKSPRASA